MVIIYRRRITLDPISEEKWHFVKKVGIWSSFVLLVYSLTVGIMVYLATLSKDAPVETPRFAVAKSSEPLPPRIPPGKEETEPLRVDQVVERILIAPLAGILLGLAGVLYFVNRLICEWIKSSQRDHGGVYLFWPLLTFLALILTVLSVVCLIGTADIIMRDRRPLLGWALLALLLPAVLVFAVRYTLGVLIRYLKRNRTAVDPFADT